MSEATGSERSVNQSFRQAPLLLRLFTGQVVIGAAFALVSGNLIRLLVDAQLLNGVISPVLLSAILVLANRRSLLGDAANGPVFRAVATVCVAAVAVLSVVAVTAVAGGL